MNMSNYLKSSTLYKKSEKQKILSQNKEEVMIETRNMINIRQKIEQLQQSSTNHENNDMIQMELLDTLFKNDDDVNLSLTDEDLRMLLNKMTMKLQDCHIDKYMQLFCHMIERSEYDSCKFCELMNTFIHHLVTTCSEGVLLNYCKNNPNNYFEKTLLLLLQFKAFDINNFSIRQYTIGILIYIGESFGEVVCPIIIPLIRERLYTTEISVDIVIPLLLTLKKSSYIPRLLQACYDEKGILLLLKQKNEDVQQLCLKIINRFVPYYNSEHDSTELLNEVLKFTVDNNDNLRAESISIMKKLFCDTKLMSNLSTSNLKCILSEFENRIPIIFSFKQPNNISKVSPKIYNLLTAFIKIYFINMETKEISKLFSLLYSVVTDQIAMGNIGPFVKFFKVLIQYIPDPTSEFFQLIMSSCISHIDNVISKWHTDAERSFYDKNIGQALQVLIIIVNDNGTDCLYQYKTQIHSMLETCLKCNAEIPSDDAECAY
jgi:hypothetical protein